jgi:hypothetical protein
VGFDGSDDDGQATAERGGPAGKEQAQGPGERKNPLADRDIGDDVGRWLIATQSASSSFRELPVCGSLDHAASPAGGAEAAAFAGKSHQQLMAAASAFNANEALLQSSAVQVILNLLDDEAGQVFVVLSQMLAELGQMIFHHLVEQRQLGPMADVGMGCDVGQGRASWEPVAKRCFPGTPGPAAGSVPVCRSQPSKPYDPLMHRGHGRPPGKADLLSQCL